MPTSEKRLIRLSEDELRVLGHGTAIQRANLAESLADRYEDGITEEEADWAAFEMALTKPHGPDRAALIRKLRSLSQSTPEGEG